MSKPEEQQHAVPPHQKKMLWTELKDVAKMASHAIFQYNFLAIDDTHNTWTNLWVKMIIIRLIGPRDEKIQNTEEIRSKGPRQR